jgi:two-component system, OmpR family, KDP operon response regulator KdpE
MSAGQPKILIVDDEPPIRKLLRMGLRSQGYELLEAPDGRSLLELLSQNPDLIILDLELPDIEGLDLLQKVRGRNQGVPIVVLSNRGDEAGKVEALDSGANDYVTKPFGMDELAAWIRAALRHHPRVKGEPPIFRAGALVVDLNRQLVMVADEEVKLSPKEYALLQVMVRHAGKVLTHKFLLTELWDEAADPQTLRVYVRQLRQKIEADPERPRHIVTETGVGYRLRAAQTTAIPGPTSSK